MSTRMTSRERVFAALEGRVPDRLPIVEMFVDRKVIDALQPGISYEDFTEWVGYDAVSTLAGIFDEKNIQWVDKENKIFRDKWGVIQQFTDDYLPLVQPPPRIESVEDLKSYTPPDPGDPSILRSARQLVDRFKGDKAIIFVGEADFAPAQYLRCGLENLMIDYKFNPELVKKIARICMDYYVELYRNVIKEGVEIILLGDDYAGKTGTYMSPADFERFILPGLRTVVAEIKKAGAYCIKHSDGNLRKILDQIVGTGVDALGPLEPVPGMELDIIKKRYENKVCVMGNINIDLLSRGSVEEVIRATKECIARVSSGGSHILSSANTICSSVKPDNLMAMIETVKRYGQYPIDVRTLSS